MRSIQDEAIHRFQALKDDPQLAILYVIQLGKNLAPIPPGRKNNSTLVKGCHTKTWVTADRSGVHIQFHIDSDSAIIKGLAVILIRIFYDLTAEQIMNAELYFMHDPSFKRFLGSHRADGLTRLNHRMKELAQQFVHDSVM